jgi:hypothetical protein
VGDSAGEEDPELGHIRRTLWEDLDASDPWLLPIKEWLTGGGQQAPQMQGTR